MPTSPNLSISSNLESIITNINIYLLLQAGRSYTFTPEPVNKQNPFLPLFTLKPIFLRYIFMLHTHIFLGLDDRAQWINASKLRAQS
jgi:hypothetical protein